MRRPNCFLLGAPKCGSTSLAMYLADHPNVFLCDPKEPNFWADEIAKDSTLPGHYGSTLDDYLALFAPATDGQRVLVDASTSYLWSASAPDALHAFDPAAKYIALLRNPVDLVYSLHQEEVYSFVEPLKDFEDAWALQEERRAGRQLPAGLTSPQKLQYRRIGSQLEKVLSVVPRERLLVLFLDDLANDPAGTYRRTLAFLGLPDIGKTDFETYNKAKAHRFPLLTKLLWQPPPPLAGVLGLVKAVALRLGLKGLRSNLVKHMTRARKNVGMSEALRVRLTAEFLPEIEKIERLTGRDLAAWKAPVAYAPPLGEPQRAAA